MGRRGAEPERGVEEPFDFQGQAGNFDLRAGIPSSASARIAQAIRALADLEREHLLLELGAGTGEIGCDLAQLGLRYLGLDVARAMLLEFRRKLGPRAARSGLLLADANAPWPVASESARVVFLSRAAHLFQREHLVREVRRVAAPQEAWLVLGQSARSPDGLRARLRAKMRELLSEHGIEGKSGRRTKELLVADLGAPAQSVVEREVCSWNSDCSVSAVIAAWRNKPGLAGHAVAPSLKESVLARLGAWAESEYGDPQLVQRSTERYQVTSIRVSKR